MSRPSIDETMLEVARVLSKRGTCAKKQVGAVALDIDKRLIAGAYNGAPKHRQHCTVEEPCLAYTDHTISCFALHAESNLLLHCDARLIHTVYITEAPCNKCLMLLQNTNCKRIVYYSNGAIVETFL